MNNGGEKRWSVVVIDEFFKIYWLLYERRYDTPLRGSIIASGSKIFTFRFPQQKQASSIPLKSPHRYFVIGCGLNVESGWTGVLLVADAEEWKEQRCVRRLR